MFSLTAAAAFTPNPVRSNAARRRTSHRREAVAGLLDFLFPKKIPSEEKKSKYNFKKEQPPAVAPLEWHAKFDEAVELYAIEEVALECASIEHCGGAAEVALDALGKHADADEARAVNSSRCFHFFELFYFL